MTPEELEGIIDGTPDPERRATAYAALTLTRILAPEWTHVVVVRGPGKGEVRHETVKKPAGQTFGPREELQARLDALLTELRAKKDPPPLPKELREILSVAWLKKIYEQGIVERFWKSWAMADRHERKTRLDAVTKLAVELDKVKQKTIQATGLAEQVIEDIIEGDWDKAARFVEDFTFNDEDERYRAEYAPIFENFVVTGRTVCAEALRRQPGKRPESH